MKSFPCLSKGVLQTVATEYSRFLIPVTCFKNHYMRIIIPIIAILFIMGCNNQAKDKEDIKDSVRKDTTGSIVNTPAGDTLFTGFGNEPFWAVYVIGNIKIVFHPMDGNDVEVPFV